MLVLRSARSGVRALEVAQGRTVGRVILRGMSSSSVRPEEVSSLLSDVRQR
jgi:hypothetical protein